MERIKFENVAGNYRFIIAWLENNIEPANKYHAGAAIPYHGRAISQFARYAGKNENWHVEVRGLLPKINVEITDPRLAVKFGIEHSCAK